MDENNNLNGFPEEELPDFDEFPELDELEDARLAALAQERLAHFDPSRGITLEELDQEFGFDQELYDSIGEIEFE